MAVWYIDSVQWTAVTAWAATTAQAAGVLRRQLATPTVGNERVFACIVAGTTLGSEPAWTTTKGAKTVEAAGPTWQECTGQPGVNGDLINCLNWAAVKNINPLIGAVIQNNAGTYLFICSTAGRTGNGAEPSWTLTAGVTTVDNLATWTCLGVVGNFGKYAAPHARLANAYAGTWGVAGDIFFVGDDHAWSQTSSLTIATGSTLAAPSFTYCVDHTVVPPGTANLKTTATETSTGAGAGSLTLNNGGYFYGITFKSGTASAFGVGIVVSPQNVPLVLDSCSLQALDTAASTSKINFQSIGSRNYARLINTTMKFGNTGDGIAIDDSFHVRWEDTPSAILGSTFPATLFARVASNSGSIECEGVDLSAIGSSTLYGTVSTAVRVDLINCKLGSGYVLGAPAALGGRIDLTNCDSGGTNYVHALSKLEGSQVISTTVVRTGGASDGATPISWKIATTANSYWFDPFVSKWSAEWNALISTNRVVTLAGIWNSASLPNTDDIWLHVEYLGSSGSPLSSPATQTKANNLATGSALPADSVSQWDSNATARQNSHAYSLGDIMKVADNSGRIFFCTTAGTSAGSEPGGYSSAADGGSVTDSGATFRAGVRFSLTVTLSSPQPAQAGYLRAYVKAAKQSSTFYVDPQIQLS